MGFLSFTRKRKTSEHLSQSPPKRNFSSFSLRPRSFFDSNEPPTKLEPANPRPRAPRQRSSARDTRERAALLHDLNANYFSQSLPSTGRGATFHPGHSGGGMDWRAGATAEEASRHDFTAFMERNGLSDDMDGEEELLPPPTRRAPRADGRPIGLGEFGRHSMFDAPCAPVEPLSKVPTNASLELPPGAMHPTPPRIDFAAEVFRPIDWGFKKRNAAMSSTDNLAGMIRQNVPPPIVPPRSHLRTMSAHPMSPSSSASSSSAHSHSNNGNGASQQQRQYVLEVAPPMPQRPSAPDEEVEVISFGSSAAPKRKTERAGSFPSQSRDPFKVRDGLQPRKASSGVYTPNTFPGARTEASGLSRTPSNVSTASSQLSPPPMCNSNRTSRLSGLKRISVGFGHGQHGQRNSVISSPTVISVPSSLGERSLNPVARQASSSSGHTDRTSTSFTTSSATDHSGRRYGHSPTSSTHSASSISPPATPTTPTESKAGIVDPNNSSPDLDKASSSSSPTGPKRTRRKPVPQMDVDLITRLEQLEMESK